MSLGEIRNATIVGTMLGYEDHGIMTCMISTSSGSLGQGFGGYRFDKWNGKNREGTAYGCEFVRRVLVTVGVESWEQLKGKNIRLDAENHKIHGIGHIIEDKWFYPEKDLKHYIV